MPLHRLNIFPFIDIDLLNIIFSIVYLLVHTPIATFCRDFIFVLCITWSAIPSPTKRGATYSTGTMVGVAPAEIGGDIGTDTGVVGGGAGTGKPETGGGGGGAGGNGGGGAGDIWEYLGITLMFNSSNHII